MLHVRHPGDRVLIKNHSFGLVFPPDQCQQRASERSVHTHTHTYAEQRRTRAMVLHSKKNGRQCVTDETMYRAGEAWRKMELPDPLHMNW